MRSSLAVSPKRNALVWFFALVLIITWAAWIPAALATAGRITLPFPVEVAGFVGAWAPSLLALLIAAVCEGGGAVRQILHRLSVWRVRVGWYLFALLWPVALSLATTGISTLLGSPAPNFSDPPVIHEYPAPPEAFANGFLPLLPMVFVTSLLSSALGEELGWRGFALPRLQAGQSALTASLILGVFWGLWHLPRLWMPGEPFDGVAFVSFLVGITLEAVLYTWVFNNTRGSLLPVLLLHTATAVTKLFLASASMPFVSVILEAMVVALVVLGGTARWIRASIIAPEGSG